MLQNGAKVIQKLTPGFKNQIKNLDNFRQALESQKIHLSKKYIPSAKKLYIEDLSDITFKYLCENSPNYL